MEYNTGMGPLGAQEMFFIFILALLLFGPKKLPELGRTIGKAMTEFRRAQNELKTTFSREMENLERETGVKELTATNYMADSYNYDSYDGSYYDGTVDHSTTYDASASATEGAEHMTEPLQIEAAAESVPHGHVYDAGHSETGYAEASADHAGAGEPVASAHNEGNHAVTDNPVHG